MSLKMILLSMKRNEKHKKFFRFNNKGCSHKNTVRNQCSTFSCKLIIKYPLLEPGIKTEQD
ncbi:unnamed protein product [Moneuplotes crassus]|uniref:Uncharacterized protein n=1 Tax=Euplotes crassus TaxID=5936 RepID=A0AAD1XS74_EUPCR|nr:unnamed protein product [Moneuplotes crassus]